MFENENKRQILTSAKNGVIPSLLFLLLMVCSCERDLDLSRFQEDTYYVAHDFGNDIVLYLEDVSQKSISGRWYVEEGFMAQPHHFVAEVSRAHKTEMRSDSLSIQFDSILGGDTIAVDLLMESGWHMLRFVPWQQPSCMEIHCSYPYHEREYDVSVEKDIVYARAPGYWTSYPELVNGDDYLSVVMDKMNAEDLKKKDLDLTMDVYRPITDDTMPRPLLLLIHGGAFFNGDKASIGYPEWGNHFASLGYVVASINYRIGFLPFGQGYVDRAGYRAVQDAYAALCYLLRHPERYPINPSLLFVGGTSAGGITALNLAFMDDEDRPDCTKEGFIHRVSQAYNEVADFFFDDRKRQEFGNEDLGDINAVALQSGGSVDFDINAVVNMWGAVHKLDMIDDEKNTTAILSFHGDADSVVAYGYDYPFTNVATPAIDFVRKIRRTLKESHWDFFQTTADALGELENKIIPLNQFLCGKMYGSKCIHQRADSLMMVNELHTKVGGGHSLHVDNGSLSDYFTLITDTTARFLYLRMFPRPDLNVSYTGRQQWFKLDNAGEVKTCCWEAVGGLVLEAEHDRARVIFFDDATQHKIRITGQKKDDEHYDETYDIRRQ